MLQIKEKAIQLIDALKATCKTYGMGNDGNEYKIITQVFLYKFLNDKFGYEVKNADIFSTQTTANTKIPLFEPLTQFVTDSAQRAPFARPGG